MRREDRLRQRGDFKRAFAGRAVANRAAVLFRAPNAAGRPRVGFAVPRHVGGAVRRNRVKRQFREAYRRLRERVSGGWDLVFLARPTVVGMGFGSLSAAVEELLRRSELLAGCGGEAAGANAER